VGSKKTPWIISAEGTDTCHKVAHSIRISGIDQELHVIFQQGKKESSTIVHAVALEEEALVDLHVAT